VVDPAAAIQAFTDRIESYASLRDRLEEPLPSLQSKRDTWSGFLTKRYLASAIRTARARAQQGDIFTPAVTRIFLERFAEMTSARDEEGLLDGFDIGPLVPGMMPAVNDSFPVVELRELPAVLLKRLPPLPRDINYRMVGPHLILWDADAEIVIDVLPDAVAMGFDV
jgi:hypothetical protein